MSNRSIHKTMLRKIVYKVETFYGSLSLVRHGHRLCCRWNDGKLCENGEIRANNSNRVHSIYLLSDAKWVCVFMHNGLATLTKLFLFSLLSIPNGFFFLASPFVDPKRYRGTKITFYFQIVRSYRDYFFKCFVRCHHFIDTTRYKNTHSGFG